ncbi:SRPBCC domain-containing protein [uncultured Litoreibacter sp.]|uniref:SRPBCC family protein n=1 Tax=uncultured Litoreibacter sp. TaxID=1392394 RepID=UPI0026288C8A|nr:SRPBCC domain-containing protein [uncultured Litoreibacter sp.]
MTDTHYTASILVNASPAACFKAATTQYDKWWTKPDAPMRDVGDRSKFTFPPGKSYWTFEATLLVPNERVEMTCVDALHLHEGQPAEIEQEWLDTVVRWEFTTEGNQARVKLDHIGLKPNLLCFDICKAGWDFFFLDSLKAYLETGEGKPHTG